MSDSISLRLFHKHTQEDIGQYWAQIHSGQLFQACLWLVMDRSELHCSQIRCNRRTRNSLTSQYAIILQGF